MKDQEFDFYHKRIGDAWADIRAYGSNLWQIVMLSIAASALIVNLISRPDTGGILIFSSLAGWFGFFILSGFTFFPTVAVLWISKAINERITMIYVVLNKIGFKPLKKGNAELTMEKGWFVITPKEVEAVLHWTPIKQVVAFSAAMWITSVASWFIQVFVTFYSDLYLLFTLLFIQFLFLVLMGYILNKEYRDFSESGRELFRRRSQKTQAPAQGST